MKKVIVQNLYAVGMHHWGGKELSIGPLYYCRLEEGNPEGTLSFTLVRPSFRLSVICRFCACVCFIFV